WIPMELSTKGSRKYPTSALLRSSDGASTFQRIISLEGEIASGTQKPQSGESSARLDCLTWLRSQKGVSAIAVHVAPILAVIACKVVMSANLDPSAAFTLFSRGDSTTISSYNFEDRDYLIRTVAFEAPNEPAIGEAAVAHVVLNRKKSGRWGHEIKRIVTQPWQFEPWMTRRRDIENLSPDDPRYRKEARIADAVLDGDIPDPTSGATHFLNETIVRQRRGGSLPR